MDATAQNIALIIVGLSLLYYGAESLIRGASSFALRIGLSPLVIGLTVVGYGTSMPELIVSVDASLMGRGEIAIGNVIGSNICNIGLIMGISACLQPLPFNKQLIRCEVPIVIALSLLFPLALLDGEVTRWKGLLFLIGLACYTTWAIKFSKSHDGEENRDIESEVQRATRNIFVDWLFIAAGFAGMWLGARLFVTGTIAVAKTLGVSDAVIGLTIVAFGTSLPELATSLIAIIKNQRDLAVGNLIGSNIFNILGIVGATGLINPIKITDISWVDFSVMLLFALLLLPFGYSGRIINRWEGAALLFGYFAYIFYLGAL